MSNNFHAGDVVQLKSGSPALTVLRIADNKITVAWYDDSTNGFKTEVIIDSALEPHKAYSAAS